MQTTFGELAKPVIIGRSSSHFTRVTRIFAAEMGIDYSFRVVRDLMSSDPADYGGNPALRIPTLHTSRGVWFGALTVCRELWRQSSLQPRVVWPEDLDVPVLARVNGHALGGGMEMVLGCDIVIAAENASFGLPEPRVGRLALDGGIAILPRRIPHVWAMGMLLTGRRVPAETSAKRPWTWGDES
jgi:hypothetical protein